MDIHNLATVMTPNILYPSNKTATMEESYLAIEAVASLIMYNDTMCEVGTLESYFVWKSSHDFDRSPKIFSPS